MAQEMSSSSLGPFLPLCASCRRRHVGCSYRSGLETKVVVVQVDIDIVIELESLLSQFKVRHHVMSDFELT